MNVRKSKLLSRKSLVGKLLRLPFRLIPSRTVLWIISGPLQGKRWIKGSHNLSVVLGTYERLQSQEFFKSSKNVDVFWDLGAHVGYYSLLFRAGNPTGEIVGFEPVEINAGLFNDHMRLNRISGFTLHGLAVSNQRGVLRFAQGTTTVSGHIQADGERSAEVIRLSEWVNEGKIKVPQLIKMDIEGEELKVLQDLETILKTHRPKILLSTHSQELHEACMTLLGGMNYSFKALGVADLENHREVFVF